MFSLNELSVIDRRYFEIIEKSAFTVTLRSRNTRHCWHIVNQEYGRAKNCAIYHRHKNQIAYHAHGHEKTISDAISEIVSHDEYQKSKDRTSGKVSTSIGYQTDTL